MESRVENDCPLAGVLAERLSLARHHLTAQWLDRIANRVSLDPNRVFPTDELLDHVPLLIEGIADYLRNPAAGIAVDMPVVAKAMELGELRHKQGFDAYEILKEYEFLGRFGFCMTTPRCTSARDCTTGSRCARASDVATWECPHPTG